MGEKEIIKIFNNLNINITNIKKANNSFSSNVYIVSSKTNKYILKILVNDTKRVEEAKYLDYLHKSINVPKLIYSKKDKNYSYNILEFIEGKTYLDNEISSMTEDLIYKTGELLGKLHSIKLLENKLNSFYDYLKSYMDKAYKSLRDKLKENKLVYDYLKENIEKYKNSFDRVILHLDYRIGNIIYQEKPYLIDLESMKTGDAAFDFLKMKRCLNKKQYKAFLEGYKSIRPLPENLDEKLEFYNIFDAYTSLNWCIERNFLDSDFYKQNYKILQRRFKK